MLAYRVSLETTLWTFGLFSDVFGILRATLAKWGLKKVHVLPVAVQKSRDMADKKIIIVFLFYVIPCDITQQLRKKTN